jgi:hypothetical protein
MEDPGWKPTLRRYALHLVAPWTQFRRRNLDGLTQLRHVWLALTSSLFLFLFVLYSIRDDPRSGSAWFPIAIVGLGVASLARVIALQGRRLDGSSAAEARKTYLAGFFKSFAAAELPAFLGIVGFFVTKRLWVYLIAMPFTLIGMFLIAPGRGNLARVQQTLRESGSSVSLVDALMSTPLDKRSP